MLLPYLQQARAKLPFLRRKSSCLLVLFYGIVFILHPNKELNLHLMIKKIFILLIGVLCAVTTFAQNKIIVIGKVTDAITGKPIENVYVKIQQQNIVTNTDTKGVYELALHKKKYLTLVFSHVSYVTSYELLDTKKDTIELNIKLKLKLEELPVADVESERKPEIVFKSTKISISDYEFHEDKFIFLAYGKRLNKDSEIYLVNEAETILSKHFIPGTPVELYTDYLGNINLICKKSIYRVGVENDKVSLYELPLVDFYQLIKPIVDTLDGEIIFSDFLQQYPRFKYYAFNPEDTNVTVIKEVVHKEMDWQYHFEYEMLNNAEKQFAKRMSKKFKGLDRYDIAASMTGFSHNFMYEEVYAPLFVVNDTINIFDHHEDKIWKFIDDTIAVGEVAFDYHHPSKKSTWKRQLIMDEVNGKIYGLFRINGYYHLKEIDSSTGEIVSDTKLTYQYVDEVKIKDGRVYYTYKPRQTLQKKFLYKEWLE